MNHNLELAKMEFEFHIFHFMLMSLYETISYLQFDEKNMEFLWLFVVQSPSCIWLFVIHGLQCARCPCHLLSVGVYSNSCLLSWWCHTTILSRVTPSPPPSIFPSIRGFSSESVLHVRWPKFWSFSFSINPSNEYSGLISFRTDWFDLPAVQQTLKR